MQFPSESENGMSFFWIGEGLQGDASPYAATTYVAYSEHSFKVIIQLGNPRHPNSNPKSVSPYAATTYVKTSPPLVDPGL